MATLSTTKSALLSGAAKDDVVGLNGDFNFTIADLLGNDPGGAAKVNVDTQFFFGVAAGRRRHPTITAQVAYLPSSWHHRQLVRRQVRVVRHRGRRNRHPVLRSDRQQGDVVAGRRRRECAGAAPRWGSLHRELRWLHQRRAGRLIRTAASSLRRGQSRGGQRLGRCRQ